MLILILFVIKFWQLDKSFILPPACDFMAMDFKHKNTFKLCLMACLIFIKNLSFYSFFLIKWNKILKKFQVNIQQHNCYIT